MVSYCKENLNEIKEMIGSIESSHYTYKSSLLSNSSIGQHVRHILEFYICLIEGESTKVVNYDKRKRNLTIETDLNFTIEVIQSITAKLDSLAGQDFPLTLEASFDNKSNELLVIPSSFSRELAYCLEHSIHHQALIKIGLIELNCCDNINSNFGVAPATIKHKEEQCVQ